MKNEEFWKDVRAFVVLMSEKHFKEEGKPIAILMGIAEENEEDEIKMGLGVLGKGQLLKLIAGSLLKDKDTEGFFKTAILEEMLEKLEEKRKLN